MKKLLILLALACPASAQTLKVYPASVKAPKGSYQTISAIVNGANDKSVTWTTTGGTLVGDNPCTQNGICTIALTSSGTGTFTVTATSRANPSVTQTSTVTFTATPTITTGHPRLFLTPALVNQLKTHWGSASNCSAITDLAARNICNTAVNDWSNDNASTAWGTTWSFNGGSGTPATSQGMKEVDACYFALLAMLGDSTHNWAGAAHDVGMYTIGQVNSGSYTFSGNDWSDEVDYYSWMVDWMLGAGSITSSPDISAAHSYLYAIGKQLTNNGNGLGGIMNSPINDVAQFTTNTSGASYNPNQLMQQRAVGNNYTWSKLELFAAVGFTFDDNPTDDPALTNTCSATRYQVCPDYTAGSLHAYGHWLMGAWMLKAWAHLEDPDVVQQALNAAYPSGGFGTMPQCQWWTGEAKPCFGDGREGESSEGSWYQYSFYRLGHFFAMLHTAGVDDPLAWGPQVSLATSSWTDLKYLSDYSFLTGWGGNNNYGAGNPGYSFFTTGDTLNYVRYPADFGAEMSWMTYDSLVGRTDRSNALWYLVYNAAFGKGLGTAGGCTGGYCGFNNEVDHTIFGPPIFDLAIVRPGGDDPQTGTQPTDPRSTFPTDLYNSSFNQHQLVRDSWTENGSTIFSAYCPNTVINHEYNMCGRFDLLSNGEYITKGRTQFNDYNYAMMSTPYSNTLSLLNTGSGSTGVSWAAIAYGGQFSQADRAGFASVNHSELPGYSSFLTDDGGVYNGAQTYSFPYDVAGYANVSSASADIIYLRGAKTIVRYDRGAYGTGSSPTSLFLNTTGNPTVTGNVASWLTRSGTQKAYFTSLLGGTLTANNTIQYTEVSAPYGNLQVGTNMQGTCTAHYASGSTGDVTSTASWESWNTSALTVSSSGVITAVATGSATIHCKAIGFDAYMTINAVTDPSSGTGDGITDQDETADWEVYKQLQVSAGSVASAQFLSTLEWGNSSFTQTTPTAVTSTSGQGFDGAMIGSSAVLFMRSKATFTGTTYPAGGATSHYISDLSPNTTYTISASGAPSTATADSAGVMTFASDGTGNVSISTGGSPTAATPTFSPASGSYIGTQSVTLSTTSGSVICFNTTGSPATNGGTGCAAGSTLYSGAISVASSETLYAVAGGTGYLDSPVGSAAYTIGSPQAATPTCSPVGATYTSAQTVTCSSVTTGSVTRCTTDGTTPNGSSPICTAIPVSTSLTIKAFAQASGFTDSAVHTENYVISIPGTPQVTTGNVTISGTVVIQ